MSPMPTREKQRAYQRSWLRKRREAWLRVNGPCVKCGSDHEMEVDHIDPAGKVSHAVWSWSAERRRAELAKCQVLCAECHKAKTAAQRPRAEHGTRSRYVAGCRCCECRAANNAYARGEYYQPSTARAPDSARGET